MALIVPPLPAPSRPSNTMQILRPCFFTHSWRLTSSACSFFSSFSYSLSFSAPPDLPLPMTWLLAEVVCSSAVFLAQTWSGSRRRSFHRGWHEALSLPSRLPAGFPDGRRRGRGCLALPAAAQGPVESNNGQQFVPLDARQRQLEFEQVALRDQDLQEAGDSAFVAQVGEAQRVPLCLDGRLCLRTNLLLPAVVE